MFIRRIPIAALRSSAFAGWVLVFVAVALMYPRTFEDWFGFDLAPLIVPLIQIIMFGVVAHEI